MAHLFGDNVDHIWQNYGIAENVDKMLTASLLILWQRGQTLTLLTLLTPIYGEKTKHCYSAQTKSNTSLL
jgi:hypothetical protein